MSRLHPKEVINRPPGRGGGGFRGGHCETEHYFLPTQRIWIVVVGSHPDGERGPLGTFRSSLTQFGLALKIHSQSSAKDAIIIFVP